MKTHASPFVGRIGGLHRAVLTGLTVALVSVAPRMRASDLHRYAQSNAVRAARAYLVQHGAAAVNLKERNDVTALHIAAARDHVEFAQLLIDHGAEIDARTSAGFTPLHRAVMNRSTEAAFILAYRSQRNRISPLAANPRGSFCARPSASRA